IDVAERFSTRQGHGLITFGGFIYIIGGRDGTSYYSDIWRTKNGFFFEKITDNAPFGKRSHFALVEYSSKLYIIAGDEDGTLKNDVWESTNATSWAQMTGNAAFSPRKNLSAAVINSKILVSHGQDASNEYLSDIWTSSDAILFTRENATNSDSTISTKVLIHSHNADLNTDFINTSPSGVAIFREGSTYHSTDTSAFEGSSIFFDGINDSLELDNTPNNEDLLLSAMFTFDLWFKTGDKSKDNDKNRMLLHIKGSGSRKKIEINILSGTGAIQTIVNAKTYNGTTAIDDDQWHHFALSRDTDGFIHIYLDGAQEVTPTKVTATLGADAKNLHIGRRDDDKGHFSGYMDEIRLVKGEALFTSSFTPPKRETRLHFTQRQNSALVTFDNGTGNKIYSLGGLSHSGYENDVMSSSDGITWTTQSLTTSFPKRSSFATTIFNNGGGDRLYIMGGSDGSTSNSVHSWRNEASFETTNATAFATASRGAKAVVYNSNIFVVGGNDGSNNLKEIFASPDGSTFSQKPDFMSLDSQIWTDTDIFSFISQDFADSSRYKIIEFDRSTDNATIYIPNTEILSFSRKDANNYLGVASDGKLLYSTNITFNDTTTVLSNTQTYKSPVFSPSSNDFVYAIKEVSLSSDQIVKIEWNGSKTFGAESNLTPSFTENEPSLLSLSFSSDGKDLFFVGTIPPSGSVKMYKVSTNGSGLTTFLAPNPKGSALILDGEKYNPYVSDYTIQSSDILDQSIYESRIALGTITAGDFVPGGLTEGSFTTASLRNFNFAASSLTYAKWESHSIQNIYLASGVITSLKIDDASLLNSVIKSNTLDQRVIQNNTFSTAHILANTITHNKIIENTISNSQLDNDLVANDFALKSLHGNHFINLSAVSIKEQSLSSSKYQSAIFNDTHFQNNQIKSSHIKDNSIDDQHFLINQLEGELILDLNLANNKIANNTILSANLEAASVLRANIKSQTLLSRHFRANAFATANMANDVVTTRTLALSSITFDKIAASSFNNSHFNSDIITAAFIKLDDLTNSKMQSKIFTASNFAAASITNSDWIKDNDLISSDFDFNQITQDKLTNNLTSSHFNTASFEGKGLTGLTSLKILDQSVKGEHFQTNVISSSKINNNALTYQKLKDLSLQEGHFQDSSIVASSFVDISVLGSHVKSYTLESDKIKDGEITNSHVQDDSINTAKILDRSLQSSNFDYDSITRDKITSFTLLSANIAANTILTTHIINGILTTSEISSANLTQGVIDINTIQNVDLLNNTLLLANFKENDIDDVDLKTNSFTITPFKNDAFLGSHFITNTIASNKVLDGAISNSNLSSDLTSDQIANATLSNREIATDAITGAKILDASFTGARFSAGTITNSKLKTNSLIHNDFNNLAFTNNKFVTTASDFTSKTSDNAEILQIKVANNSLQSADLSATINAADQRVFANSIVTDAKLAASPAITSAKVNDGELTAIKIADNTLSSFANNNITKNRFNSSGTGGLSAQIAANAATNIKFQATSVGINQVTGTLSDVSIQNVVIQNEAFENVSINEILDNSIEAVKILSSAFMTNANLPILHADKFAPVGADKIQDGIFVSNRFQDGYFTSTHLDDLSGSKFATNSLTGEHIIDGEITVAQFDLTTITSDRIKDGEIQSANLANGGLIADNLKDYSITNNKIIDNTILGADFDSSNTDNIASGGVLPANIHQHSPFAYKRNTKSGYTLIDGNTFGRTQFNYKLQTTDDTLKNAQTTCSGDKAQVCDTYQLINMCRSGQALNDGFYFASNPYFNQVEGKNYLTYPMLKLGTSDCFAPQEMEYDFMKSQFTPVKVTDLSGTIRDIYKYNDEYIIQKDSGLWNSDTAWLEGTAHTDSTNLDNNSEFIFNYNGESSKKLLIFSSSILKYYDNVAKTFTDQIGYTNLKDITFFGKNTNSDKGIVIHNTDKVTNIFKKGFKDGSDISIDGKMTAESSNLGTPSNTLNGYQYDNSGGNASYADSKTYCRDTIGGNIVSFHSQAEVDFVMGKFTGNFWMGAKDSGTSDSQYVYSEGSIYDFAIWKAKTFPNDGGAQCVRVNNSGLFEDKSCSDGGNNPLCKTAIPKFQARYEHSTTIHDNKIIVSGGLDSSQQFSDIWTSTNGSSWTKTAHSNDPFLKLRIISNDYKDAEAVFDSSGQNYIVDSNHGGKYVYHTTDSKKNGSSSIFFPGDAYISIIDDEDWDFDAEFTVEFWMNNTDYTAINSGFMRLITMGNNVFNQFQLYFNDDDNGKLYFNDNLNRITSTTQFKDNSGWNHIAIVRDASDNIKMYING
ncbi:hypothetical protein MJH12_16555, partial [bacterium]|nr:hypothetical protein [bacterium]